MTSENTTATVSTERETILVRDGAINWIWYHRFEKAYRDEYFFPKGESFRLHKFDERQGADQHPKDVVDVTFTHQRPDYRQIKAFGISLIDRWVKACKELNMRDDEIIRIIHLADGRKIAIHGQGK
jgi:hypothetical protein